MKTFINKANKPPSMKIGNGNLIQGDCLSIMEHFPDNHFILGFTSPPYLNAINYDAHVEKLNGTQLRWNARK